LDESGPSDESEGPYSITVRYPQPQKSRSKAKK